MKKATFIVVAVLLVLYVAAIFVPVDPVEQRPGTRLAGEWVETRDVDWSFVEGRKQIYVQSNTWYLVPHSVTTTSWVVDGEYYVPCGWCATKRWPRLVAADPNVVIKVDGKLYARRAVLIEDDADRRRILGVPDGDELPDAVEVYRMDPREA
jgi:hypothetical protein